MHLLGVFHEMGRGIPVNQTEAIRWCVLGDCAVVHRSPVCRCASSPEFLFVLTLCIRYRRAAAAGMVESQTALREIAERSSHAGNDDDSVDRKTKTGAGGSAAKASKASSSSSSSPSSAAAVSVPTAAAAAQADQECAHAPAEGLHSSIHRAVAITRIFSQRKQNAPLRNSFHIPIVEGSRVRVKVTCC